jgi:hypothetical protein
VLSGAVLEGDAARVDADAVRIAVSEPAGRGGGGGAEDGVDALLAESGDGFVEEREIEEALFGLDAVPGELGHADDVEAGGGHAVGIFAAVLLVPVFGVVCGAEEEMLERGGAAMGEAAASKGFELEGVLGHRGLPPGALDFSFFSRGAAKSTEIGAVDVAGRVR